MPDAAERAALAAAIKRLDKKIKWRGERIVEDRMEIEKMVAERDELADRYAELILGEETAGDD